MLAMGASLVLQYSYRKMPFHTGLEKSKQKRNFDGYHTTDIMWKLAHWIWIVIVKVTKSRAIVDSGMHMYTWSCYAQSPSLCYSLRCSTDEILEEAEWESWVELRDGEGRDWVEGDEEILWRINSDKRMYLRCAISIVFSICFMYWKAELSGNCFEGCLDEDDSDPAVRMSGRLNTFLP